MIMTKQQIEEIVSAAWDAGYRMGYADGGTEERKKAMHLAPPTPEASAKIRAWDYALKKMGNDILDFRKWMDME